MKKSILFILVFLFLVCPNFSVDALRPSEIAGRVECPNIELAEATVDGLNKIECYDDYNTAKTKMLEIANDNLVLIESGMVIDAKYAVVDYDANFKNADTKYIRVYANSSGNSEIGYIRTAGNYADEAPLLDYDYNTKRVKIKVSGVIGWIAKNDNSAVLYDVVPLIWVKSPQYYKVTDKSIVDGKEDPGNISHVLPYNIYGGAPTTSSLDIKPSMLNPGNYYSYDAHYFYTDLKTLINDYKANNYNNSVNKDNPYFNYYQYLSFRTKSIYDGTAINEYLNLRITNKSSKMLNTGQYFNWVQENYGVNAVLMMAIGRNESGSGTSDIAQNKNNLFGLNAVDSKPGEGASYYATVEDCIKDYGYRWLSYWYLQPGDSHYRGANLGNKYEGLNVKYASDPYWGETAAHFYYDIDKRYGFQDRDKNIAVLNGDYNNVVYARKSPNGELIRIYDRENDYYQYKTFGTGISIISEVTDENNNLWYKIQSEPVLDGGLNYIGDSKSNPRINYNWNTYVYVEAKYFIKINTYGNIPQEQVNTNTQSGGQVAPVSSVVNNSSLKYETGIIAGIKVGTTADSLVNNLASHGGVNISVVTAGGSPRIGNLGTGDKITITSGNNTETLEVVVAGDTDGDGSMSAMDYVNIKNHIMETRSLNGAYLKAADVDNDGGISAVDYVNVKNYIMNQ